MWKDSWKIRVVEEGSLSRTSPEVYFLFTDPKDRRTRVDMQALADGSEALSEAGLVYKPRGPECTRGEHHSRRSHLDGAHCLIGVWVASDAPDADGSVALGQDLRDLRVGLNQCTVLNCSGQQREIHARFSIGGTAVVTDSTSDTSWGAARGETTVETQSLNALDDQSVVGSGKPRLGVAHTDQCSHFIIDWREGR